MKKVVSGILLILLLFVSMTALYGGWLLIEDPSGASLKMSITDLDHAPFKDYFIPGILLFVGIGLGSLSCLILFSLYSRVYKNVLILQGSALIIWITVQVIMIQQFNVQQLIYLVIGGLIVLTGIYFRYLDRGRYLH